MIKSESTEKLEMIRYLNRESGAGLMFCYKALKRFDYDEQRALEYLRSDAWKRHILMRH